jgi:hypothetical protein
MGGRYPAASGTCAPGRRSRTLCLLAGLVLAGLWFMHGVSATTEAGCHGMPVLMTMGTSVTDSGSAMGAADAEARTAMPGHDPGAATFAQPGNGKSMQAGSAETCLSGQPPSPGDFLLALLASLAVLALVFGAVDQPLGAPSYALGRLRRRGPPGPVGRALLTTVCISRT